MGTNYCDEFVCLFVCQLVYLRNHSTELHQIFVIVPVAVAWSSYDGVAIRYALPVLWITSCFRTLVRHVYRCGESVAAETTASIPTKFCLTIG